MYSIEGDSIQKHFYFYQFFIFLVSFCPRLATDRVASIYRLFCPSLHPLNNLYFSPFFPATPLGLVSYDNFDAQEDRGTFNSYANAFDGATFGTGGLAGGGGGGGGGGGNGEVAGVPQQADL